MTREEAIKELRDFIGQLTEGCQEIIKILVPELRESEDEKAGEHWQPCDEHFRALGYAIEYFKKKKNDTTHLEDLYNGLKKIS